MKSAKNQFGKQQPKHTELGTENRRTHDRERSDPRERREAVHKTRNTKQETPLPRGPNIFFLKRASPQKLH